MKRIIGVFKPFSFKQKLFVYEDDNKIDSLEVSIEDLKNAVFMLSEKYEIDTVDLSGPKQYVRGLSKQLEEAETKKYNKNSITFNII